MRQMDIFLYEIIDDAENTLVTIWNVDITSPPIPKLFTRRETSFFKYIA